MSGSVRPSRDPGWPWDAICADGQIIACESLSAARHMASCPPIGHPPDPVPPDWFRRYLAATGLSAPRVAQLLGARDDRHARRWKAGTEQIPRHIAILLAAWADGVAPELDR